MALKTQIKPWKVESPLRVDIEYLRSAEADMAALVPGSLRTGGRSVSYSHTDLEFSFKALQAMVALGGIASSRWARNLYTTGAPVT